MEKPKKGQIDPLIQTHSPVGERGGWGGVLLKKLRSYRRKAQGRRISLMVLQNMKQAVPEIARATR